MLLNPVGCDLHIGEDFCLVEPAVCLHTPQSVMSPLVKMVYFW